MKKPLSVLLVDDDDDDYFLTMACLRDIPDQRFDVTWASNYDQALVHLSENHFDICFFDHFLGARTGLDLFRIAQDLRVQTPIILLTGKSNVSIDIEAMRLGVTDYLVKDELEPEKLERSIRYAIDRTATLKALKESEEKYRGLFEGSVDVICLLDAEGRFTAVNEAATRLLGYSKADFLDKNITGLFEDDDFKVLFSNKLAAQESIREFEVALLDAKGESKYCIIACTCHHLPGNRGEAFFQVILHDVSRRKKAEQDLLIAEKLAATGRFVRMLAHEIRNPLTNIDLAIEQLLNDGQDEESVECLDIIRRNSKRIGQLLTDLLQTSNPTLLSAQACNPSDLIDQTLDLAADRIVLKNIQLEKHYSPHLSPIQADAEKLKIALFNIIINAVEIMEAGRGVLTVSAVSDAASCRITISDNGPGIAREHLNKLFDPYFSRKPNGLGLGLASTLNIVQAHGGRVEVDSELGKGAEFTVWLPTNRP